MKIDYKHVSSLYLEGLSLRHIGEKLSVSHITVRNILNSIEFIDPSLFILIRNKMEENKPDSLEKPEVLKRVLVVLDLFLNYDMTVIEIANKLNSTEFIIYRDLTARLPHINEYTDQKVTNEVFESVLNKLKIHSMNNSPFITNKSK